MLQRRLYWTSPGKELGGRAKALALWLKYVFQEREEICVAHSLKTAEIMLRGLDNSFISAVVIRAVLKAVKSHMKRPVYLVAGP